jgi:hypothetical protein
MRVSFVVIFSVLFIAALSCKKSSTTSAVAGALAGSWKPFITVSDSNDNKNRDSNDAVDTSHSPYLTVYYADGTGAIMSSGSSIGSFTWQLTSNDTYLKQTRSGIVTVQHIDSLTNVIMVLRDTSGITDVWQVFTKQ